MSGKPTILILDKNRNSALILSQKLAAWGANCELVQSADEVIQFLKANKSAPDLVVVELMGNDPTVHDLPNRVKVETEWGNVIPIVAHSVLSDRESVLNTVRAGFADYIIRPVEQEVLRTRIWTLINQVPKASTDTFQYPVYEEASLSLGMTVIKMNEVGMVVSSKTRIPAETLLQVNAPFLKDLDIGVVSVKLASEDPNMNQVDMTFVSHLTFVGITGVEVRKLRKYCIARSSGVIRSDAKDKKKAA